MITLLACECGSSEELIRQTLHKYEFKGWATQQIFKGKAKSLAKIEELIRAYPQSPELQALFSHVNNIGKWVVILGHDDGSVRWTDISKHDMKSDIEAEAIIANFS